MEDPIAAMDTLSALFTILLRTFTLRPLGNLITLIIDGLLIPP